ncbi:surf-like protein [Linderina macrospora]|uniref:Surf-like protein n=1 Tax=Linderina macrospora TaxID=4868 RepID=A0ACC1J0N6_9FUNG|nr:surf-like protein [Linderina macrospora]
MHRRPIAFPLRVTEAEVEQNEYRRVIVHGHFDYANEMLVGPRLYEGEPGFIVVAPLVREDGSRVLVNRGWIKRELRDPKLRPKSRPEEAVTLVAFVRRAPGKNSFTPEPKPEINEWYSIDVEKMAKHAGTQQVLLESIQPESMSVIMTSLKDGVPLGVPSQVDIRNNHLQYLLIWYILAGITSGMLFYRLRKPSSATETVKKLRSRTGGFLQ